MSIQLSEAESRLIEALRDMPLPDGKINGPGDWYHELAFTVVGEGRFGHSALGNDWGDKLAEAFEALRDERLDKNAVKRS